MRAFLIPELFFRELISKDKECSPNKKLYVRFWAYWFSEFVDEIFKPDFIENQKALWPKVENLEEIHKFGIQFLGEFKIVEGKKKKSAPNQQYIETAKAVISYLNEKLSTKYRYETSLEIISSRLKDGYDKEDLFLVIDKKCKDWLGTDRQEYLRPSTLFNKVKFEAYINEAKKSSETNQKSSNKVYRERAKEIIRLRKDSGRA